MATKVTRLLSGGDPATGMQPSDMVATESFTGANPNLKITVRVYNFAQVAKKGLGRAEREAAGILKQAGIVPVWIHCPTSPEEVPIAPACQFPLGPTDIVIRILPRELPKDGGNPMELGIAVYPTKDDPNRFGSVSSPAFRTGFCG